LGRRNREKESKSTVIYRGGRSRSMGGLVEEWEGCIKKVLEDSFIAHLHKVGAESTEIIEGEFKFRSITEGEQHLIKEGTMLYWVIGREVRKSGTVNNSDHLILRRKPSWENFDVEKPSARADNFFEIE
jgi:hypothetical protein